MREMQFDFLYWATYLLPTKPIESNWKICPKNFKIVWIYASVFGDLDGSLQFSYGWLVLLRDEDQFWQLFRFGTTSFVSMDVLGFNKE